MPKRLNGSLKWFITLGILLAGIVASYAVLGRDVQEMKPEVKLNSKHRIQDDEREKITQAKLDLIIDHVKR